MLAAAAAFLHFFSFHPNLSEKSGGQRNGIAKIFIPNKGKAWFTFLMLLYYYYIIILLRAIGFVEADPLVYIG